MQMVVLHHPIYLIYYLKLSNQLVSKTKNNNVYQPNTLPAITKPSINKELINLYLNNHTILINNNLYPLPPALDFTLTQTMLQKVLDN